MWVKGQIVHRLDDATGGVKDVLTRATQPHLFDRLTWFQLLWAHNRVGLWPVVARSWGEGSRCWLFLAAQSKTQATALANYYTLAFRPIFSGSPDSATQRALLIALARRLRRRPTRLAKLSLSPVPAVDGSADLLHDAFRRAGWIVFRTPVMVNWIIDVGERNFDSYWAERPGALRSTYARKVKKADITTEIHRAITDSLWAEYEAIYAESWKPEEGSLAFVRAMAEEEASAGCLRLGIARLDGIAIAAQLWTLEPGRALIHKLAYRADAAGHSPGTILTAAMFRHVIDEDRVSIIDYGTGDDTYKADWMDTRNTLYRIDCFSPIHAHALVGAAKLWFASLARGNRLE